MSEKRLRVRQIAILVFTCVAGVAGFLGYTAPLHLAHDLEKAAAAPTGARYEFLAEHTDLKSIDAHLTSDLRAALHGRITTSSFAELVRYGAFRSQWARSAGSSSSPARAVLAAWRFESPTRARMILWADPGAPDAWELVLYAEKQWPFGPWRVVEVRQFSLQHMSAISMSSTVGNASRRNGLRRRISSTT